MQAPFPWFGGKSKVAHVVWDRFGTVANYVEPFFGSGAVLLNSPYIPSCETINDLDGYVCNFWRSIKHDPEQVAHYCDWPVNENDLHARHIWLVNQRENFVKKLEGDPDFYDAKIAGFWCWGICLWIGCGWCSGDGPWKVDENGQLDHLGDKGTGVHRQLVHLGNKGKGVHRQRVHLGDKGKGVHRQRVHLGDNGTGVHRKRVHLGDNGLIPWFLELSNRLRQVRVCCGDWSRVCGTSPTTNNGLTAVFLDPPYGKDANRYSNLYSEDSETLTEAIQSWCKEKQGDPLMKIALCGYIGEYDLPGWECFSWKSDGGYRSEKNKNRFKERIWFSPHCLKNLTLFQDLPI